MKLNTDGLKEAANKSDSWGGSYQIAELLTDDFIARHTDFQSLQSFTDASGLKSPEDFQTEDFAKFLRTHTRFDSWDKLVEAAFAEQIRSNIDN